MVVRIYVLHSGSFFQTKVFQKTKSSVIREYLFRFVRTSWRISWTKAR